MEGNGTQVRTEEERRETRCTEGWREGEGEEPRIRKAGWVMGKRRAGTLGTGKERGVGRTKPKNQRGTRLADRTGVSGARKGVKDERSGWRQGTTEGRQAGG